MPRLQMERHEANCACSDCALYGTPSQLVYVTNTSGAILPNTFTVTGTTYTLGSGSGPVITGIKGAYRPCGLSWYTECSCGFCYKPQLSLQFEESPVFRHTKTEIPKHEDCPKCADYEIANKARIKTVSVEQTAALNKALTFLSGLNLQNHPVKDQREQADVLREIMKVLKPERYNK